jgi:hypothetical protein
LKFTLLLSFQNLYEEMKIVIVSSIVFVLLATAIAHSTSISSVYSQGPVLNQQQDANNLTFKSFNATLDGIVYPIRYNITDNAGEIQSIVADKDSFKLLTTITPTKDGKLTVILPRDLIDYKVAGGKDGKFQVNINAKPISTYQEMAGNKTTRGLEIDFGKDDRAIEIVGTQMGLAEIADVKEEAIEAASPTNAQNVTNNDSQTEQSITNRTIEGAEIVVNKSASVLGNLSGEVGELLK